MDFAKIIKGCLFIICMWVLSLSASPNWHTIHTEHFNVHYSQGHEQWARSAATELEIVRAKVWQQQQRALDKVADVVVFDPYHAANGFALPSTGNPLMALFTTPPQSDTVIANMGSWQQLLILHEYIHLVHLSQPSRHSMKQLLRNIWDVYDVAQAVMPRWVAEGYATLMESKMTGRGRLYDNHSEAILKELAQQGALLSYDQLNSGNEEYMSQSMAYLLGGRFLAWLEIQYSEQTLDAVWTRMHAVQTRDFEQAFIGAFGEHPGTLYRRFIAEFTYQAMAKEQEEPALSATLWQDYAFAASSPTVSPDGSMLAIVERDKKERVWLRVYDTADDHEAQQRFIEKQQAVLAEDPSDIADIPPKVFAKKTRFELEPTNFAGIRYPQWVDDETLYFVASVTDSHDNHVRRGELFSWSLTTGNIEQLTYNAGIRRFAVKNDKRTVYAEQVEFGFSQLVKLDLVTGQKHNMAHKKLGLAFDFPVLSADDKRLAYLKRDLNQHWQLSIKDLQSGELIQVPMPKGYQYLSQPRWSRQGNELYFVAGVQGNVDLYRYELSTQAVYRLSEGQAMVSYPLPLHSGELLFLSSRAEGVDMYQLPATWRGTLVNDLAVTPQAKRLSSAPVQLPDAQIYLNNSAAQAYNPWQQSTSFAMGLSHYAASTSLLDFAVKGSDFLERLSWHAGVAYDLENEALKGGFINIRYQNEQLKWDTQLFDYELTTHKQSSLSAHVQQQESGIFSQMSHVTQWQQLKLIANVGGLYARQTHNNRRADNHWWRMGLTQSWQYDRQSFAVGQKISARWLSGEAHGQSWQGHDFSAHLFGKAFHMPLYVNYQQSKRDTDLLSLGGFSSSLLTNERESHIIYAPELPFFSTQGREYQGFGAGLSWQENAPWVYYMQHQMDSQIFAQTYGIKWSQRFNGSSWLAKFSPAGISDLRIDIGLGRVESDTLNDDNRVWLGFWYDL